MSDREPWTIERISRALGTPALTSQFLSEINRTPAEKLLTVFARWQGIADSLQAGVQRGRELLTTAGPNGEVRDGGEWVDITDKVKADADRLRGRAA